MKTTCVPYWVFAVVALLLQPAPAVGQEPKEVGDLKLHYNAAIAKSVQDLTEVYKNQLLELQKKFRASHDNVGISATTDELVRLGVTSSILPASPVFGGTATPAGSTPTLTGATPTAAPATVGDDKFFANKSWWSPINSEFHFKKDGIGIRTDAGGNEFPFAWRKMEDGIVEVSGPIVKNGPATKLYFKFVSKKEAVFGSSKNAMNNPLRDDK